MVMFVRQSDTVTSLDIRTYPPDDFNADTSDVGFMF